MLILQVKEDVSVTQEQKDFAIIAIFIPLIQKPLKVNLINEALILANKRPLEKLHSKHGKTKDFKID